MSDTAIPRGLQDSVQMALHAAREHLANSETIEDFFSEIVAEMLGEGEKDGQVDRAFVNRWARKIEFLHADMARQNDDFARYLKDAGVKCRDRL